MKEGRSSFLKKRSKKLLSVAGSSGASWGDHGFGEMSKSFFASFFSKKEESFSC
jgi:hypothetical protein